MVKKYSGTSISTNKDVSLFLGMTTIEEDPCGFPILFFGGTKRCLGMLFDDGRTNPATTVDANNNNNDDSVPTSWIENFIFCYW